MSCGCDEFVVKSIVVVVLLCLSPSMAEALEYHKFNVRNDLSKELVVVYTHNTFTYMVGIAKPEGTVFHNATIEHDEETPVSYCFRESEETLKFDEINFEGSHCHPPHCYVIVRMRDNINYDDKTPMFAYPNSWEEEYIDTFAEEHGLLHDLARFNRMLK